MDLHSLNNEGWTNTEIAEELGYHPTTVAKWLKAGDPPERVAAARERAGRGGAGRSALCAHCSVRKQAPGH